MSKISKDGFEQIKIIKAALDSMYDKLDTVVYTKVKPTKNEETTRGRARAPPVSQVGSHLEARLGLDKAQVGSLGFLSKNLGSCSVLKKLV